MANDQKHGWILTIRPEPDRGDPTGIRRLRAALKCLLRSFRLRCVRAEPENQTEEIEPEVLDG